MRARTSPTVVHLTGYTFGITARADGPFKTWQDVVALAKENPGKADLRDARHRHLAAHRHGTDCGPGRHSADARPLQGRGRDQCRGARRSHEPAGRLHRLETAGRGRSTAAVGDLDGRAQQALARHADAQGVGLSLRVRFPFGIAGPKGMDPEVVKNCTMPSRRRSRSPP